MFSPNKKKPNLHERMDQSKKESRPLTEEVKKRMWATVALTFILLFIYYGCIELGLAQAVMIAYFVVFTVVIVGYLIYNRAFVNKDVTNAPQTECASVMRRKKRKAVRNVRSVCQSSTQEVTSL